VRPGSELLKIIGKTLREATHIKIVTCIEQKRKDDVEAVHVDSFQAASFSADENIIPIDNYHDDMNKFSYAGDDSYQAVLTCLLEALEDVAAASPNQP
jgi:hypothetical protein